MKPQQLLPAAVLYLSVQGLNAQCSGPPTVDKELFELLRRRPTAMATTSNYHMDVVNDRFEPCTRKRDARYVRIIRPTPSGAEVRIVTPHGFTLMTGSYADREATIPNGEFKFFDDAGTLRAEGRYSMGRKTGVWHRFDDLGRALSDKLYDGLDWEGQQVKLGLASMCCYLEPAPSE